MADASGSEPDVREDVPVQVRPRLLHRIRAGSVSDSSRSAPSLTRPALKYPDGETEIIPRFERGVPGSSPGRGTDVRMCSWESSAAPTRAERVRILPSLPPCDEAGVSARLSTG